MTCFEIFVYFNAVSCMGQYNYKILNKLEFYKIYYFLFGLIIVKFLYPLFALAISDFKKYGINKD